MSNRETGTALVSVLLLVFLIAMVANLVFIRASTVSRDALRDRGSVGARYAAEGGLARARHDLRSRGELGAWAESGFRVGQCTVTVVAERSGTARWRVAAVATGRPAGRQGARVVVRLEHAYTYSSISPTKR